MLVDRYKRGIANFIGATVRNSSEAADLSQETFLRAYAHLGTFNPQLGKFSTWIYQIARNVSRTYLAKSMRSPQLQELPAGAHARRSAARSFSAGRSGRRIAARRGRARAARRLGRAPRANADGFSPSLLRQHGISSDRNDAGPLARQRQDAHSSRKDRAHQEDARTRNARGWARFGPIPITEDGVRCSSCEPLLDSYLEATLRPAQSLQVGRTPARLRRMRGAAERVASDRRAASYGEPSGALRRRLYRRRLRGRASGVRAGGTPSQRALAVAIGLSRRRLDRGRIRLYAPARPRVAARADFGRCRHTGLRPSRPSFAPSHRPRRLRPRPLPPY